MTTHMATRSSIDKLVVVLAILFSLTATDAWASASGRVVSGPSAKPISGSSVTLWAVGTTYKTATEITSAISRHNGAFSFEKYTCPAGDPFTYVTAVGGHAGGKSNPFIGLMSALTQCTSLAKFPKVTVNEISTVAAQYAFAQFTDGTGQLIGSPVTNTVGIGNAFALAESNLANPRTGLPGSILSAVGPSCGKQAPPANCNGLEKVNSLANLLRACVRSSRSTSFKACPRLFSDTATPTGATTLQAIHSIASNPANSVADLFALSSSVTAYSPSLGMAPTDWTIGLNYQNTAIPAPAGVAVDGAGDVWIANSYPYDVVELNSVGQPLSPADGYTGGGLAQPSGIAIDQQGFAWITNYTGGGSVTKLDSSGNAVPGSPFTGGGLDYPENGNPIAIDANGNAWVANWDGESLSEFDSAGTPLSPSTGFTGAGDSPNGVAINSEGEVWTVGSYNNTVTEFDSSGSVSFQLTDIPASDLNRAVNLAIDASNNVWVVVPNANAVIEVNSDGTLLSPVNGYTGGGLNFPNDAAIDGNGNVWIANFDGDSATDITELAADGSPISPASGYTGGGIIGALAIAIDPSGNVWITNGGYQNNTPSSSVSELVGAAAPVGTPVIGPPKLP
jgi:streptogramin lyase